MRAEQAELLCDDVSERRNILIAGGTSTGKATLVNALLAEVARTADRVVLIEDARELKCNALNLVALRTKDGVAFKMTGRSLVFVGRKIGDPHHATILHGVRAIKGRLDAGETEMVAAVGGLMARLQETAGAALAAMQFVVAFIAAAACIAPAGHFGLWLGERLSHRRGHR
jgi:chromosomal replication initiation ATPase DnaA